MSDSWCVYTQHWQNGSVVTRIARFPDFDSALAYGKSISPDIDGSMMPNVDDKLAHHPRYEKGLFWFGNNYGVITDETRRTTGKTAASNMDIGINMSAVFYYGTTDLGMAAIKRDGEIREGTDVYLIVSTRFEDVSSWPVVVPLALPMTWLWDNIDPAVREMCPSQQAFFRIMRSWSGELNVLAPIPARYITKFGK